MHDLKFFVQIVLDGLQKLFLIGIRHDPMIHVELSIKVDRFQCLHTIQRPQIRCEWMIARQLYALTVLVDVGSKGGSRIFQDVNHSCFVECYLGLVTDHLTHREHRVLIARFLGGVDRSVVEEVLVDDTACLWCQADETCLG